jgi:hypothetical protein
MDLTETPAKFKGPKGFFGIADLQVAYSMGGHLPFPAAKGDQGTFISSGFLILNRHQELTR